MSRSSFRFVVAALVLCSLPARAQHALQLLPVAPADSAVLMRLARDGSVKPAYRDSAACREALRRFMDDLQGSGYLAAGVDCVVTQGAGTEAWVYTGSLFRWAFLSGGGVDEGILREAGFRERVVRNRPVTLRNLVRVRDRLLDWCDRNGYPFAEAGFDSVRMTDRGLAAALRLDLKQRVLVDSVLVRGDARLSPVYLAHYLALKPGKPYDEVLVKRIPDRIRELPMVREVRPSAVDFHGESATVYLYLADRKASQLDGIVGVLPDNSGNGKVTVTGDVHIKLFSAFGYGELFDLNWKQPLPKTQDLKARFNYPFLFSTPLGIDLGLSIYKKDSTYLELNRTVGLQFLLTGTNHVKAFYTNRKSTLINTTAYENATVLPPFADIGVNGYGLGLRIEKLDYRLNPRSGIAADWSGSVGRKRIEKNSKLAQVNYDSLALQSTQYTSTLEADGYFPLGRRYVLDLGTRAGLLQGEETFQNELFRIGGLKSLRGFDEESILASSYVIWKAEVRYVLEQNSYLFLFVNGAWYERRQRSYFLTDTPFGFGAGITFETGLGIFSLNYALGREFGNPVLLRAAKVHFGLVNYF